MKRSFITLLAIGSWLIASSASAQHIRLVAFGDSGTYGSGRSSSTGITSGVPVSQAFPALIEQNLRDRGWDVEVTNKGVPGDLASRALSRVERDIPVGTHLTLVMLGSNDRRAGASPESVSANLRKITEAIRARGSRVLLMLPRETENPIVVTWHAGLWDQNTQYPFPEFDSGDREHLNLKGNEIIASRATPHLEKVLRGMGFKPKE